MALGADYLQELKKRAKESRVYRKYQLIGLEIAELLQDRKHKSLYIKLAKESGRGGERILRLAKEIAENKNIRSRGAYFMRLWSLEFSKKKNMPKNQNVKPSG